MTMILVTGGAGFIASHLTDELLNHGHKVVVVDDLSGGFSENVSDKAIFIKGDIQDHIFVAELFKNYKFDYVFHFAAYAAEGLSHFIKRYNYTNNLIGSVNLINESIKAKVKCFVYASSIAVYGDLEPPLSEEMSPAPTDSYGLAKLTVEKELEISRQMFDLNYITFRMHNVYGERQNVSDPYRNVAGIFIRQLLEGKPMTIFGDGHQTRAFTYIGDIISTITRAPFEHKAYNEAFNLGNDHYTSVLDLSKLLAEVMNKPWEIIQLPQRSEVVHAYANHSKISNYFNIGKPTPLAVGIQKMVKWVLQVGLRPQKRYKDIEITEKIPKIWLND